MIHVHRVMLLSVAGVTLPFSPTPVKSLGSQQHEGSSVTSPSRVTLDNVTLLVKDKMVHVTLVTGDILRFFGLALTESQDTGGGRYPLENDKGRGYRERGRDREGERWAGRAVTD